MKKFILITGASGGIGQATAKKLAKEGYSLYLHFNENEQAIQQLLTELRPYGGEYIPIQANLAKKDGYKRIVKYIFALHGIVHNAGNSHYGMLIDLDAESAEKLLQVHVKTPILLTKELLPKLFSHGEGSIVVVSSIWGQTGAACEVMYSTVKGAQLAFVKALSKETALNGVRVNAITPGAIATNMLNGFTDMELRTLIESIPMGKIGQPHHVAEAVHFLLSTQASYITGQVLAVNGGWYT